MQRSDLPQTRGAARAFYEKFLTKAAGLGPDHLWHARRWLCRNDLFFLLVVGCKRKDMNHDWLFARCREVEAHPNGNLDLWSRGHYKSTIVTFGLSLQDILASHGEGPEARYEGREVTIGIFSHTRPIAKGFLRQIKVEAENNEDLKALFPDILWAEPKKQAPKWSEDDGITFRRKSNPKEQTVEAWGLVDGQPTSKHFGIRVYDDVVTDKSVTPDMILKTTAAWELSTNLGARGGWERYAGTRYAMFDTYRTMMDRGIPTRTHACTTDGSEDFTKSVLLSPEELAKKRREMGPYTFGAQMLLDPTADKAQAFKAEWLKYWPAVNSTGLNIYIVVDPASGKNNQTSASGKKKRPSDYTCMWVIGVGGDENYYVLDVVRDRLNLTARCSVLMALHRKWKPRGVGYEEYGLQADIEHIELEQERANYRFTITRLGGAISKEDRIKKLVPVYEQGRMFLPQTGIIKVDYEGKQVDLIRTFIEEEYQPFPVLTHDDMLDAQARILDTELGVMFPQPTPEEKPKWMLDLEIEMGTSGSWETA